MKKVLLHLIAKQRNLHDAIQCNNGRMRWMRQEWIEALFCNNVSVCDVCGDLYDERLFDHKSNKRNFRTFVIKNHRKNTHLNMTTTYYMVRSWSLFRLFTMKKWTFWELKSTWVTQRFVSYLDRKIIASRIIWFCFSVRETMEKQRSSEKRNKGKRITFISFIVFIQKKCSYFLVLKNLQDCSSSTFMKFLRSGTEGNLSLNRKFNWITKVIQLKLNHTKRFSILICFRLL